MPRIRVLILRAAGTNCDRETEHAWQTAGADAECVHIRRVAERPELFDEYRILTIPGGFSYGDDIAAGRIFAARIERHLLDRLHAFVDAGKLVLGICNGFQILVQAGLLPIRTGQGDRTACTVTHNQPAGFQDRWVRVRANDSPCAFLEPGRTYEFPIANGEGRVHFGDDRSRRRVLSQNLAALCYVPQNGTAVTADRAPYNPNGSDEDVAGLCDETGRVFGLMPHPERFVTWTQHPLWTSLPERDPCDGLAFFRRALAHLT